MADGVVVHLDHRLVHVMTQLVTVFEGTDLHLDENDTHRLQQFGWYEAGISSKNTISNSLATPLYL